MFCLLQQQLSSKNKYHTAEYVFILQCEFSWEFNRLLLKHKYISSLWVKQKIQLQWTFTWSGQLMSLVFINSQMIHRNELWDSIFSSLFIKDGPLYPTLQEAIKEALTLLSSVFGELEQLLLWPPRGYFHVTSLSRNLPKQIGTRPWSILSLSLVLVVQ